MSCDDESDNKEAAADKANNLVKAALKSLCEEFRKSPTQYLEEKHLHNEFDRILRTKINDPKNDKINITAKTKKENDVAGVKFPLIMNEYTTVHHYSRQGSFEVKLDDKGWPGSLDYVWLWDEWVSENSYCTAVNKDVDFRRGEKGEGKKHDTSRYLVVVEFKFDHYAKYMATMDKENNDDKGKPRQSSITSALNKMKKDMQTDLNKVCYEEPPFGHVVYFNSRIPLPKQMDEASNSEEEPPTPTSVEGVFEDLEPPQSLDGRQITLWYMQGGVETRFPSSSQNEDEFPLIEPPKK